MTERKSRIHLPTIAILAIGAALGLASALIGVSVLDTHSASVASTIATTVAVVVAMAVGLLPWLIAKDDRRTRSVVIASRVVHDLQKALNAAEIIRDGVGHVAETSDAVRIQLSAKRCLPMVPQTLDETFDKLSSLPFEDAKVVCRGVMAAIDQYLGVHILANVDLEEGKQAFCIQLVADNVGIAPADLELRATTLLGKQMMQIGRRAAARAMDAQARIPPAIALLRQHGAVIPTQWGELFESPIPEVARAVQVGTWPRQ